MINRYKSGHSIARGIYLANRFPELKDFNTKHYSIYAIRDDRKLKRAADNLAVRCGNLIDVMLDSGAPNEDIIAACKVLMVATDSFRYSLDYSKACKEFKFYELCKKYGLNYERRKRGDNKV